LKKITDARLKSALPFKIGQKVSITNIHQPFNDGKWSCHTDTRTPCEKLRVDITGEPQITYKGEITFGVHIKYKPKEYMIEIAGKGLVEVTDGHFTVYQEEIIK
jgi:hypothetical protein